MADQKLTDLTASTTIASGDLLYGVIGSNSRKITRDNFCANMGPIVSSGTATATKLVPTGNVTAGNGMYLPATNAVAFSTNGSERMRILANGNISVGASAADSALQISKPHQALGGIATAHMLVVNSTDAVSADVGGSIGLGGRRGVADAENSRVFASLFGGKTNSNDGNGSGYFAIYTQQSGVGHFERFRITDTGNVGIGLTAPNERLEVAGNIHVSGGDRTIFNRSNNSLQLGSNNTGRLTVKAAGQTRFVPLAADPSGPENGDVYYNSATDKLRLYAAGSWVDLN
jgi:hypothetical protein